MSFGMDMNVVVMRKGYGCYWAYDGCSLKEYLIFVEEEQE